MRARIGPSERLLPPPGLRPTGVLGGAKARGMAGTGEASARPAEERKGGRKEDKNEVLASNQGAGMEAAHCAT